MEPITNETENKGPSIESQLAQASAVQRARQAEMQRYTTLKRAWNGVKNTAGKDHNTIRLSGVLLVILISLFSSLILIIASADMPYSNEALYAHSDMAKFMNDLREKALRETPPDHPAKWSKDSNQTWFSGIEREIRFLLEQWWPISHAQYDSADVILNERNFFIANFSIFRHSFTVFNVLANVLLFSIWIIFITAKEVRRIKLTKPDQIRNSWKSDKNEVNDADDRKSHPEKAKPNSLVRGLKRVYKSVVRYLARIFWWIPPIKDEWFDLSHPSGPIWDRTSFFVTFMFCLLHILVEAILLKKPSFFALLLQQISFLVLSILCLGSTYIELQPDDEENQEAQVFTRTEPKSLRGSFRGSEPDHRTPVWSTPESTKLFSRNSRVAPVSSLPIGTLKEENEHGMEQDNKNDQRKSSIARSVSQAKSSDRDEEYPEKSNPFSEDDDDNKKDDDDDEDKSKGENSEETIKYGMLKPNTPERIGQSIANEASTSASNSMKRSLLF